MRVLGKIKTTISIAAIFALLVVPAMASKTRHGSFLAGNGPGNGNGTVDILLLARGGNSNGGGGNGTGSGSGDQDRDRDQKQDGSCKV